MDDFPKAEYGAYAGDLTPLKAWEMLKNDASSELFDVRTDAEFSYVGRPDLSSIGKDIRLGCQYAEWFGLFLADRRTQLGTS